VNTGLGTVADVITDESKHIRNYTGMNDIEVKKFSGNDTDIRKIIGKTGLVEFLLTVTADHMKTGDPTVCLITGRKVLKQYLRIYAGAIPSDEIHVILLRVKTDPVHQYLKCQPLTVGITDHKMKAFRIFVPKKLYIRVFAVDYSGRQQDSFLSLKMYF
jgi:hypothetical protein